MATSLRDRILTPRTARAITSPAAILSAGAVASAAIVASVPALGAALLGAAAYAGIVAWRMPRGDSGPAVDPGRLSPAWRPFVQEALDARRRFEGVVRRARPGPLRDRLRGIADRLDTGVRECWRIARHGQELETALRQLDPAEDVERRLATVERDLDPDRDEHGRLAAVAASLRAQLESTRRIGRVAQDTRDRLRVLDARLDETVARAVELSLRADDAAALGGLGGDVDAIVAEMEALRVALDETEAVATA